MGAVALVCETDPKVVLIQTHHLRPTRLVVGDLNFVKTLPKTRSGKIMRRVFKAIVLDQEPGDITTIEEEGSVEEARQAWKALRADLSPPEFKDPG